MIKQITQNKEIQIDLIVEVDGIEVEYNRHNDRFAYCFYVSVGEHSKCKTIEEAKAVVMKVVEKMESQSYDHGAYWRRTSIKESISNVERYGQFEMIVDFRIRDCY